MISKIKSSGPKPPERIFVFVESKIDSRAIYKYDEKSSLILLKKIIKYPLPCSIGIIPRTHYDGEPLDVLIIASEPLSQGTLIEAKPVGLLKIKGRAITDNKIIAIPLADKKIKAEDISDISPHKIREINQFFSDLVGGKSEVLGSVRAKELILQAIKLYRRIE